MILLLIVLLSFLGVSFSTVILLILLISLGLVRLVVLVVRWLLLLLPLLVEVLLLVIGRGNWLPRFPPHLLVLRVHSRLMVVIQKVTIVTGWYLYLCVPVETSICILLLLLLWLLKILVTRVLSRHLLLVVLRAAVLEGEEVKACICHRLLLLARV